MPKKKAPTPEVTFNEVEAGVMEVDGVWVAVVRVAGGEAVVSDPLNTEDEARAQMRFAREVTQAVMLGAGMNFFVVSGGSRGN